MKQYHLPRSIAKSVPVIRLSSDDHLPTNSTKLVGTRLADRPFALNSAVGYNIVRPTTLIRRPEFQAVPHPMYKGVPHQAETVANEAQAMKARERETIPAFLSIDVEPDAFQISCDNTHKWPGYGAIFEFSLWLRKELTRKSGMKPNFGWYYRMDPQIEEVCGRADVAMTAFPDRTAALQKEGDYFGVHAHPLRWSTEQLLWVHDFGDRRWLRECTNFALDAFKRCNGSPAKLYRAGAGFLNNDIVEVLDDRGVVLELSLEPVASWGLCSKIVPSAVDTSPIVGEFTNCVTAPQTPYRPARRDFRRIGYGDSRRILLIPHSTGSWFLPSWRSKLKRLLYGTSKPDSVSMLYPTVDWPSDRYFWDIVALQLKSMERPYLSLAIRTDAPDSAVTAKVCRLFASLSKHPLAKRLRFVNPLEVKEEITLPQYS